MENPLARPSRREKSANLGCGVFYDRAYESGKKKKCEKISYALRKSVYGNEGKGLCVGSNRRFDIPRVESQTRIPVMSSLRGGPTGLRAGSKRGRVTGEV